jgi:hypothetical protein
MSEELRIVQCHDPQLVAINAKLAWRTTEVYAAFSEAACLAGDAIAAAQELMRMPGLEAMSTDGQALQNTIEFWRRVRDKVIAFPTVRGQVCGTNTNPSGAWGLQTYTPCMYWKKSDGTLFLVGCEIGLFGKPASGTTLLVNPPDPQAKGPCTANGITN